ncbi:MAG: type ISP restriction/modification enzyme [Promethearchaeota archaeon]
MKKVKSVQNYFFEVKKISQISNSNERSFYSSLKTFLAHYFDKEEYDIIIESNDDLGGVPDLTIRYHSETKIKIEAKDFRKFDIETFLINPFANKETKRLYNQILRYEQDGCIIILTDFLHFWIKPPFNKRKKKNLKNGSADYYKFSLITYNKKDSKLILTKNYDIELHNFLNYIKIMLDEQITKAETLINFIIPLIKESENKKNLHDEIKRIIKNPSNPEEFRFMKHLETLNSDFNETLFKETPVKERIQFIDLYTQLLSFSIFMGWIKYNETPKNERNFTEFKIDNLTFHLPGDSLIHKLVEISDIPSNIRTDFLYPIEYILNKSNYHLIINDIGHLYGTFYTDFLKRYNADLAKRMGVINTPDEVIRFIIRGIHFLLINKFDSKDGILDKNTFFLDPASGTMGFASIFLKMAYDEIKSQIINNPLYSGENDHQIKTKVREKFHEWVFQPIAPPKYLKGKAEKTLYKKHQPLFLENFFSFEILMAPFVLGYLRILMEAEELGAKIDFQNHYPQTFLCNTVMNPPEEIKLDNKGNFANRQTRINFNVSNQYLRNSVETSLRIRHEADIMVVLGNPPYSISSQNLTTWIKEKVKSYKDKNWLNREKDKPYRKPISAGRPIEDDYIKFIRFAQWRVAENSEKGIIAFITNNFYLDGIGARGLRKSLLKDFDEIFIINLHGDSRKKRAANISDESIFDISTGVCIGFFIRYSYQKHLNHKKEDPFNCEILYHELFGKKDNKLNQLNDLNFNNINFQKVGKRIDWEFVPQKSKHDENYWYFPYLDGHIFRSGQNIQGVVTGKDRFISHPDLERLKEIIIKFYKREYEPDFKLNKYVNKKRETVLGHEYKDDEISFRDGRDWQIEDALKGDEEDNIQNAMNSIVPWYFRGLDRWYICYDQKLLNNGTERFSLMQYLLTGGIGMIVNINSRNEANWSSVLMTDVIFESGCLEGASAGGASYLFPLKINLSSTEDDFSNPKIGVHSNINPLFLRLLPYNNEIKEEDIFYYTYGILNTPLYRELFSDFLKTDFPHVPFPKNLQSFENMARLGKKLGELHIMKSEEIKLSDCPCSELNDSKLINPFYVEKEEKIYFNKISNNPNNSTYHEKVFWLGGIKSDIFNFEIGGRKIIPEWLKYRRYSKTAKKNFITHPLRHTEDELEYIRKLVSVIKHTIKYYPEQNKIFKEIIDNAINFQKEDLDLTRRSNQRTLYDFQKS